MNQLHTKINCLGGRNLKVLDREDIKIGTYCLALFEDEFFRAEIIATSQFHVKVWVFVTFSETCRARSITTFKVDFFSGFPDYQQFYLLIKIFFVKILILCLASCVSNEGDAFFPKRMFVAVFFFKLLSNLIIFSMHSFHFFVVYRVKVISWSLSLSLV